MLRPYQKKAVEDVLSFYRRNEKKILLHAPTGSGKTVIFCYVLKSAHEKGTRALMVVRGRMLVDQASRRLDQEGVPHGVIMANHWRHRPHENIQVCSIDTLSRREISSFSPNLIVIDEAHFAASPSYKKLATLFPNAYYLCVTATPYAPKSLRHVANQIVWPVKMQDLVDQGYLVGPRYYAPSIPDLTGVKTKNNDFDIEALDSVLNQSNPIGDVVSAWKKLSESRPTLLFAVSVNHSRAIVESFRQAGITAEHVDAETPEHIRQEKIRALTTGELKIISNVGIFCTGVDIPEVSCIVMVRPTKSYTLFIQQAGRGTRPAQGKSDFILIDHAGNLLRHGCIMQEREGWLDEPPKTRRSQTPENRGLSRCEQCYAVVSSTANECPSCGAVMGRDKKALSPLDAEITTVDPFHLKVLGRRAELLAIAKIKKHRRGWVYHVLRSEFGEDVAQQYMPKRKIPPWLRARIASKRDS